MFVVENLGLFVLMCGYVAFWYFVLSVSSIVQFHGSFRRCVEVEGVISTVLLLFFAGAGEIWELIRELMEDPIDRIFYPIEED